MSLGADTWSELYPLQLTKQKDSNQAHSVSCFRTVQGPASWECRWGGPDSSDHNTDMHPALGFVRIQPQRRLDIMTPFGYVYLSAAILRISSIQQQGEKGMPELGLLAFVMI